MRGRGRKRRAPQAKRVIVCKACGCTDVLRFDSLTEFDFYRWLLDEQKAGRVRGVDLHPRFELPGGVTYSADFRYIDIDRKRRVPERTRVVDVKPLPRDFDRFRRTARWQRFERDRRLVWGVHKVAVAAVFFDRKTRRMVWDEFRERRA